LFIGYKQQAFLLTLVYKIGKEALICTKMLTLCLVYAIGYRLLGAGFFTLLRIYIADSQKRVADSEQQTAQTTIF
jgi:hypothetical protein